MLFEFIETHRDAIVERTRQKLSARPLPPASTDELANGVPFFLNQLAETLRLEDTHEPFPANAIGSAAAGRGRDLLALGFTVSQVVHDYGDICQAVTEVAIERNAPIDTEEFHTLNRCLDTAIAEAVTEHARLTAVARSSDELQRLGTLVHEVRDSLNTAILAFHALKRGTVPVNGSTGAVLGRSLLGLRDIVDRTLANVRLAAQQEHRERAPLAAVLDDIAVAAGLRAEYCGVHFEFAPADASVHVVVDTQLVASAVTNLVNNAFKFTHPGGWVVLRALHHDANVVIEVEDQCGGLPENKSDPFRAFGDRRGRDRSGLGLGLFIARRAVESQGGTLSVLNLPGRGCVFSITLPLATPETSELQTDGLNQK
jgi:signal transduction histidine kinase